MWKGTPVGRGPAYIRGLQGLISTDGGDSVIPGRGLQGGAMSRDNLRVNFVQCYIRDKIVILEEGKSIHPH